MAHEEFEWSWDGTAVSCRLSRQGNGPPALLLPALSSISTRDEMAPLQSRLGDRFETVAPDWPGFGTGGKPKVDWTPEAMAAWLDHVLEKIVPDPALIVAAGHGAGYVLRHFSARPETAPRIALVAPTWRGPFPTMLGRRPPWLGRLRGAVDNAATGPALYGLNLSDPVIRRMARGHVYSDPDWLTSEQMARKRAVARADGARFASIRFVTGGLDPFETSQAASDAAAALPAERLRMIWGAETPRKSMAEMAALARAARVAPEILPRGKLGLHEEFPDAVAKAIARPD